MSFEKAWSVVKAINPEWMEYYQLLERIRESGVTNMFGATPYLARAAGIPHGLAQEILISWMENYEELMVHPDYSHDNEDWNNRGD